MFAHVHDISDVLAVESREVSLGRWVIHSQGMSKKSETSLAKCF